MKTFWHGLIRYDAQKVRPRLALRNALGIGLPLAVGVALGNPAGGLLGCIGALDVAYSDGHDPYQFRARRMLAASALVAAAIFTGGVAGNSIAATLAGSAACAFAAGMMAAVGQTATDIANITLVTFIVFSAHAMAPHEAALSGLAALAGALFQTGLALLWWPVDRYSPERRVLARFYRSLARAAAGASYQSAPAAEEPVATAQSTAAQQELAALGGDGSIEAARYLMLLSQAERIRLALMSLTRIRIRLLREEAAEDVAAIDVRLARATEILDGIASSVESGKAKGAPHGPDPGIPKVSYHDAGSELEALAGQLRAAAELAAHASPAGLVEFERREVGLPWMLRLGSALAMLRANLSLESSAFRHAVRMAVVVPAADVAGRVGGLNRSYWAAMTAAIVLRPDFSSTFSRGLLRTAGTLAGLTAATALFHFVAPSLAWQVVLLTAVAFLLRCFGPANYGIFAVALTALIVLLLAVAGYQPDTVIVARGLNTIVGGAVALLAYLLWPTWERTLVPEAFARVLDAYRDYLRAVADGYLQKPDARRLDRLRLAARLARSNLDASLGRLRGEPGVDARTMTLLDAMHANALRFVHAAMALEAGLYRSRPVPARAPFRPFMEHVDLTVHFLAAVLRGSPAAADHLPDLRADQRALVEAGGSGEERHALVDVETDRIANSVNTLAREVLEWRAALRPHSA